MVYHQRADVLSSTDDVRPGKVVSRAASNDSHTFEINSDHDHDDPSWFDSQ